MSRTRTPLIVGALCVIFAAFLPWATTDSLFGPIAIPGYETSGLVTLILGVLLLFDALRNKGVAGKCYSVASSLAAFVIWSVCAWFGLFVKPFVFSLAAGWWLTVVGAFVVFVAGLSRVKVKDTYPATSPV